jgi:signal peptide peptidase SppA
MEKSKESIFKTVLKSFLRGFFLIFGVFFAFFIAISILGALFSTQEPHKKVSMEILPDLNGNTKVLASKAPVVLQINLHGIIGEGFLTNKNINNALIASRKEFFKGNRVKAILLHIKTPGGSVNDSDGIYRSLLKYREKYKTPIFAYVDGLCASGGCYISAASNKIYSNPVSIIGSVGVLLGPFLNFTDALNKIGIETLTLTDGKNKDALNPLRKWKENEAENIKKIGSYFYDRFVDIMVKRRNLNKELLIDTYGAKIFDSKEAAKIGFIDNGNSCYEETLKDLLEEAKIKEPYQVVKLHVKRPIISDLFKANNLLKGKIKHVIEFKEPFNDNFSYLYSPFKKSHGKNIHN